MTSAKTIALIKSKKAFICDMDGVIYHGNKILPGVKSFINWMKKENKKFFIFPENNLNLKEKLINRLNKMKIKYLNQSLNL